ncbi:hypothetical protein ABEB36_004112 [Hypothenemus hampei]|uniref:Nucleoporin NDC1 n=1 Tax=Hypothenemus hampei TaxID=57062 RepID=A0ABD1F279_HYPHA
MNPNLTQQTCTYKDLLLRKLSYAVTSSVCSQLVILQIYVFLWNFNVFHPKNWLLSTIHILTSFSTWIFILPFLIIVFAQSVICAKDYVVKSSYCSTRFQKFVATFSVHNLILLALHILVGGTIIWLFLSVSGGQYQKLTKICHGQAYCLNNGSLFLILSGLWTGCYFFIKVYIAERNLTFPVIYQRKFLQFKSQLEPLIRHAVVTSFLPSLYFCCLFYVYGETLQNGFRDLFGLLEQEDGTSVLIFLHLWFFSALYYFNMNLMRFYFNLFLTEPVQFPLVKDNAGSLTLQESITNSDWPIVQNLACLDLHLLAQWSPMRRQVFFSISNPGGHPYNWNTLVVSVLNLFKEYTELLNKTIDLPEKNAKPIIQAPIIQSPDRFRNLRNMTLIERDEDICDYVHVTKTSPVEFSLPQGLISYLTIKISNLWNILKVVTGINFLFGELPQANIRKCLANGNLIIWASQGITELLCASLEEDNYGIVQKDLPVILSSLVNLKQSLDKLNKVPALTRKMVGYDDFNYRMKGAVTSSIKRSLFNVCKKFENYLNDIPLSKEVSQYLQIHIMCKS